MAEEIKVVLEADASQLEAEFKKAQAAAIQFSQKVLPLTSQSLNATWEAQQRVAKGMAEGRRGVRGYSDGMLQLAHTADDAQYGLRGVLNNIPGLVMGFGAGAGLAGAISLAVLAAAKLGPLLKDLYSDTDIAKIQAVAKATAARYDTEIGKLRELSREKEIRGEVSALTREMALYAQQELRVQTSRLSILDTQRKEMELMRRLQDELSSSRGTTTASGSADLRVQRAQEDLKSARAEAKAANEEYDRIATEASNVNTIAAANLSAARDEIAKLKRDIASGEANVEGAKEGVKQGLEGSLSAQRAAERRLSADQDRLKIQEEIVRQYEAEASTAAGLAKEALTNLSDRIRGAEEERRSLEKQIPVYQQLSRLARERAKAEMDTGVQLDAQVKAFRENEARLNAELAARKQSQWESRMRDANQPDVSEGRKQQLEATRDFAVELKAARLRAAGQREYAESLEKEHALRKEAAEFAKRMGISEARALAVLREKQRVESIRPGERLDGQRSRIRIAAADLPNARRGLQGARLERTQGLRASAERRLRAERAGPDMTAANAAASYYERSIMLDERMVKALEALGTF